jgi:phosphotriesterase-related protein
MSDAQVLPPAAVNTVLGPVPADQLGIVAIHESLLSVVPGAQYAFDINLDQVDIFDTLAAKLRAFKSAGGGTVVDATGMFHGRDLPLLESLARATGIHIVASTGMGPEENLGGYFLTPQTNPPTPWPAEKFADLLALEVSEGMVIPRLERREPAGLVVVEADRAGTTPTEASLVQGSARAAQATGVPLSLRWGADVRADLALTLGEGLPIDRIIVADIDRAEALTPGVAAELAAQGAYVAIDHVGQSLAEYLDDASRVDLVVDLIARGCVARILLSSSTIGFAAGLEPVEVPFEFVATNFASALRLSGVSDDDVTRILVDNPRDVLTVRGGTQD